MNEVLKAGIGALAGVVVGGLLVAGLVGGDSQPAPTLGGTTSDDWSANSFQVNGTEVISSARAGTFTSLTNSGALTGATTTVDQFTQGGAVLATSTAGNSTLTEAEMLVYNVIEIQPTSGAITLTLPATSTMTTLLASAGDYRNWVIQNTATAATNTTIAAGTGIDLQEPDGQNVVIGQNNFAYLTCHRDSSTDVVCRVDETIPAD